MPELKKKTDAMQPPNNPPPPPLFSSGTKIAVKNQSSTAKLSTVVANAPPPPPPSMLSATPVKKVKMIEAEIIPENGLSSSYINEDYIIVDPCKNQHFDHPYPDLKVLVIQHVSRMGREDDGTFLEQHIRDSMQQDGRAPDFVVFPEFYIGPPASEINLEKNSSLKSMASVLAKYKTYGILGSMAERDSFRIYNTSVFISREGTILGKYRKRHLVGASHSLGDRVGIFDTVYGRVAVIICFDIENRGCLEETMQYDPLIVFNPTYIPTGSLSSGSKTGEITAWNVAMSSMSRQFENLCIEKQCTVLRCDMPGNSLKSNAMGTSQCISPYRTIYAPTRFPTAFNVFVDKVNKDCSDGEKACDRQLVNDYSKLTKPPTYIRSDERDNVGHRYRIHTFEPVLSKQVPSLICFYDSKSLFTACDKKLHYYKIFNREHQFTEKSLTADIVAMTPSVKTKRLFTSTNDLKLQVWKVNELKDIALGESISTSIQFTQLRCLGDHLVCGDLEGNISVYDVNTMTIVKSWKAHEGSITHILALDQLFVTASSLDSSIKIWDITSDDPLTVLQTSEHVELLTLSASKDCFTSMDAQGNVTNWDARSFTSMTQLKLPTNVSSIQSLNCNFMIVTYTDNNRPELWDLSQQKVVHHFHPIVGCLKSKGIVKTTFDGMSLFAVIPDGPNQEITLYEFISNQMPTKFQETL